MQTVCMYEFIKYLSGRSMSVRMYFLFDGERYACINAHQSPSNTDSKKIYFNKRSHYAGKSLCA